MPEPLRVCILCLGLPQNSGGAELRAFRHTQYLREQYGANAIMITCNREHISVEKLGLPDYVLPITLFFQEYRGGPTFWQMFKLILHIAEISLRVGWVLFRKRQQYDIIQSIFAASWFTLVPIPIAKALGKKVILEMTDLGADDPLTLGWRIGHVDKQIFPHQPLKYSLFLQADAYVSKCHALSQVYHQAGLPTSRLYQIASAVDINLFNPPSDLCAKHEIRKKLGLNADDTILLFVGRISEQKGLHWLLPAFRETLSYNPDLQLLIIGQVMYHARAYAQARMEEVQAWGLSNNVHFLGRVSNVDDYLKAADLFVLPTSHEGFSNAIVEAMASGLPIVTSDIPEISRSQIENNKEGLLVSAGDTKQLAQAIIQLLKHPELCARLGKAARKRVIREFTYDIIGSHYSRLYQNLNTSIDP